MKSLIFATILIAAAAAYAFAEIYKWTDTYGNVHYGDQPPVAEKVEQIHIENKNTDFLPSIIPKVKSLSEGSVATSQQQTEQEDVFPSDYNSPDYQCFDSYPGDLSSIDVRPGYAFHRLSDVDINNLTRLFKSLDRNWRGDVETVECLGTLNKPGEKKQYFTARMSGDWRLSGQLKLDIDYYNKEKSSRRHNYWWLIENSKLYFGDRRNIRAAPEWVINLEYVSAEKLAFSKILYLPNVKQIQMKEMAIVSRSLYLTELLYTNGLLTSIYKWRLN